MARIQELLVNRDDKIDNYSLLARHPWIVEQNHKCVLSPDSDGLLCGLFMSHYLNWTISGFYDGKIMLLDKDLTPNNCVFLDMEIFSAEIKSMGHHMLNYNKNRDDLNYDKFVNCIQPNLIRNYDGCHDFRLKYPLATIHMLISIIYQEIPIELPPSALAALFFTDGTFNVLFKYPENVLNWLNYLKVTESQNPLNNIFCKNNFNPYELMLEMDVFFRKRDKISIPNERGDRLRISNPDGTPANCEIQSDDSFYINKNAVERVSAFISILSEYTELSFNINQWQWNNFNLYKFTKQDIKGSGSRLNGDSFKEMIDKNPISWAMTSGDNIEYTLETPDKMTKIVGAPT